MRVFKQDEIAAFERETPGYDMLNATLAYDLPLSVESQIYVRATNLLDETALSHTSFLSTLAPQRVAISSLAFAPASRLGRERPACGRALF